MKKRIISLALAMAMCFSLSITAFAVNEEKTPLRTSEVLEMGTLYHVQNDNFTLYYIVYNEGFVNYSLAFNNNPSKIYNGNLPLTEEITLNDIETSALELTNAKLASVTVSTPSSRALGGESGALDLCSEDSKWLDPFDDELLGTQTNFGATARLYEAVTAYADAQSIVYYQLEETLTSILTTLDGDVTSNLLQATVEFTYKAGIGYVAQSAGALEYYHVMNYATKWVEIGGTTWYYAGKERAYDVLMTALSEDYEREYWTNHADYNNSNSYFFEKAFANYNS